MCWLGIRIDMAGMMRNVNGRSYLPSVKVIVTVMYRLDVIVNVSRTLIGTKHISCFIPREFSVMKFMLDPVSSSARQRIGCYLSVHQC